MKKEATQLSPGRIFCWGQGRMCACPVTCVVIHMSMCGQGFHVELAHVTVLNDCVYICVCTQAAV